MQSARIALRNIARQKKRAALLGGAIAFGVLVILLIGSFTAGALQSVRSSLAGVFGGHIYIRGEELSPSGKILARIGDRKALAQAVAGIGAEVAGQQVRSKGRGSLIFGSREETINVEGVDWNAEATLWDGLAITKGDRRALSAPNAAVLPESAARALGVEVGETVLFRVATITGQANVGELLVAAVYPEPQGFSLTSAYTGLPYLNGLLGLAPDEFQSLNITLARMEEVDAAAAALQRELALRASVAPRETQPGDTAGGHRRLMALMAGFGTSLARGEERWAGTRFAITTLNDIMEPLLSMVQTLGMIRSALFAVLLAIIMVGLLNSFRMVLIERTQEIGTLRALGMQRGGVRRTFLLEALFLTLAGALAGLAAALLAMGVLGSIRIPGSFQVFTTGGHFALPFIPRDALATVLTIGSCTLLAAWLPARKASRLRPADALRTAY